MKKYKVNEWTQIMRSWARTLLRIKNLIKNLIKIKILGNHWDCHWDSNYIIRSVWLATKFVITRSYTADAVWYRQPSGQPTNTIMLNLIQKTIKIFLGLNPAIEGSYFLLLYGLLAPKLSKIQILSLNWANGSQLSSNHSKWKLPVL